MLRLLQVLEQSDDMLKNAWRERNWAAFIRIWLLASVGLAVFFFVVAVILILLFSIKSGGATGAALRFALPFAGTVGLFALIFTPPVMMLTNHRRTAIHGRAQQRQWQAL
jgi:hypothetical protein